MLSRNNNNMNETICYAIPVSYQTYLKSFPFLYFKVGSLRVHNSNFHPMTNFTSFHWVVVSTLTTHIKTISLIFKVLSVLSVGFSSREFPSDTPGGWFTRLLIEKGPMPRCATHITHLLNRLKTNQIVSQHVHKSMTLGHNFQNFLSKVNPCSLIN